MGIGFGEHQHEDRLVLVDSDSPNLPARFPVSHVCVRITEPVALGGERGNVVSEKMFESRFFTKAESSHGGVEAVSTDDQIERLSLTFAKRHLHAARAVFELVTLFPNRTSTRSLTAS